MPLSFVLLCVLTAQLAVTLMRFHSLLLLLLRAHIVPWWRPERSLFDTSAAALAFWRGGACACAQRETKSHLKGNCHRGHMRTCIADIDSLIDCLLCWSSASTLREWRARNKHSQSMEVKDS